MDTSRYLLLRKNNGKIEFKIMGKDTRQSVLQRLIELSDEKYNFPDFPWLKVYNLDQPPKFTGGRYPVVTGSAYNGYKGMVAPDFSFYKWHDMFYESESQAIHQACLGEPETQKLGWYGAMTHQNRINFLRIAAQYPDLITAKNSKKKFMTMPEQTKKYKYLIDIEGVGYSGRIKYLMWSHRPIMIQERKFKAYYEDQLKAWEHYIPVRNDLSDLIERLQWMCAHPEECQKIAENAYQWVSHHCTMESALTEWNRVITQFASRNQVANKN